MAVKFFYIVDDAVSRCDCFFICDRGIGKKNHGFLKERNGFQLGIIAGIGDQGEICETVRHIGIRFGRMAVLKGNPDIYNTFPGRNKVREK